MSLLINAKLICTSFDNQVILMIFRGVPLEIYYVLIGVVTQTDKTI